MLSALLVAGLLGGVPAAAVEPANTVRAGAELVSGGAEARVARERAVESGERVEVEGERTEYASTFANPDGFTFTWEQATVPVRVSTSGGSWVTPDATLEVRPDGRVGPKAAVVDLRFSGGGDGADLVTITRNGRSLGLGRPGALPKPVLDGDSAVYGDVLPGVDLRMTATADSFRELLVVKSPEAAANPQLRRMEFSIRTDGLTVRQGAGGSMTAVDENANVVFSAPPALMWDSGHGAPVKDAGGAPETGVPPRGAEPDPVNGPVDGAASAVLPIEVGGNALVVTPDVGMLGETDEAVFPLYIDPTVGVDDTARTLLRSDGYTSYNWGNGSDNQGEGMGRCGTYSGYYCGPDYTQRLYFQFAPDKLAGKVLDAATRRTGRISGPAPTPSWTTS
ncbi:hypothetical protein [Streptomyces sp. NPDC051569]|uniref:hypothetical protein n=1 Tax=Streptomyces sp. NPDC051569 TaxID=3365661 RepID=UPI0037A621E0